MKNPLRLEKNTAPKIPQLIGVYFNMSFIWKEIGESQKQIDCLELGVKIAKAQSRFPTLSKRTIQMF